jgi:hypothetical protein
MSVIKRRMKQVSVTLGTSTYVAVSEPIYVGDLTCYCAEIINSATSGMNFIIQYSSHKDSTGVNECAKWVNGTGPLTIGSASSLAGTTFPAYSGGWLRLLARSQPTGAVPSLGLSMSVYGRRQK